MFQVCILEWFQTNEKNSCYLLGGTRSLPAGHFNTKLTLLVPGQGHNDPGDWNKVCQIHNIRARSIKILDFVPFYVWMVLKNSFLEFVFEIFCKTEKKNFDRRVPPLERKIEDIKKYSFSQKIKSFFFLNIYFTNS